jgi:formamidopyrimidine-DNA glycosylase
MLELPEAFTIAGQINNTGAGKEIAGIIVGRSPHKLAWYYGEPDNYSGLLVGKHLGQAAGLGGLVRIAAGRVALLFGDGVRLRYHAHCEKRPTKHQMLIEFKDGSALSASVQMYGGLGCFGEDEFAVSSGTKTIVRFGEDHPGGDGPFGRTGYGEGFIWKLRRVSDHIEQK